MRVEQLPNSADLQREQMAYELQAQGTSTREQRQPEKSQVQGMSERRLARVFMTPSVVTMVLVAAFPIIFAIFLSLCAYQGRQRTGFTVLGNYVEAFTDPRFWDSVIATFVFTVASVTFEFLIGMGFALIMNRAFLALLH